jgi:hypothetical protein
MQRVGGIILQELVNADAYQGKTFPCPEGHAFTFMGYRTKRMVTLLGEITMQRAYYYDAACHAGTCPQDKTFDIAHTSFSPGMRRIMGRVGALRPFGLGHEDIHVMAGITVTAKEIERVSRTLGQEAEQFFHSDASEGRLLPPVPKLYVCMDGTGVPVVKRETEGRQGKDGQAKTREAKLGCVFTQTTVDKEGRPVRDKVSTTYTGAIEDAETFGWRLYQEANRRGMDRAQEVNVLGDGALWIWNIAEEHFPQARQIVDLYHACEHYGNVARACLGQEKDKMHHWMEERRLELDQGRVEDVIIAIKHLSTPATVKDLCEREMGYFEKNKERMRYAEFRRLGLFVGSGVLEAGCRAVIGQRLKQSGMHWSVNGANSIIALRCCLFSNRWEDFWEYRAAA